MYFGISEYLFLGNCHLFFYCCKYPTRWRNQSKL